MLRSLLLLILAALTGQAGADGVAKACNLKIERDRIGALVLGQRISGGEQFRSLRDIELPGESNQVAKEIVFACGAKVLAILGSRSEVATLVVQDSSIPDMNGIRIGMTFQHVRQKLPGAKLYSGEEEGGYLTLGSGRLRYIFATAGLAHTVLSNQRELVPLAKSQALEEIRLMLPAK
jgi:hypothetical protein